MTLDTSFITGVPMASIAPFDPMDQSSQFDFSKEQEEVVKLLGDGKIEEDKTKLRRDLRRFDVNIEEKRQKQQIQPDETFIPIRSIDQAIGNVKPAQIAFIESSRRLVIFKDILNPSQPTEDLEISFTDHMKYNRWNVEWHRMIDSMDLHGMGYMEVRFDITKPGHCSVEHIQREHLIFPEGTKDIQKCERLIRTYEYAAFELEGFVKQYGFDADEVRRLVDEKSQKRHELVRVFRVFKKVNGEVWVYWTSEKGALKFLKEPTKLQMGIYDLTIDPMLYAQAAQFGQEIPQQPVEVYPIFPTPFEIIEDEKIINTKGLAAKELPTQEALTALWTGAVNGADKASHPYVSTVNNPNGDLPEAAQASSLRSKIHPHELKFWNFPYPDPMLLQVATGLATVKLQEQGQVNFAAMNRKDSKKTAEEISASVQAQQLAQSENAAPLSIAIREVYQLCWQIFQSQIFIGAIKTCPIPIDRITRLYKLSAAGDIDVIQRAEKKQLIQTVFPMLSQTPAAGVFLDYMLATFFPEEAQKWQEQFNRESQLTNLVGALATALAGAPRDQLTPEQNAQLDQLLSTAQSVGGGQPNAQSGTPSGSNRAMADQSSDPTSAPASGAGA